MGMIDMMYRNYYECPNDGTKWTDVWSCTSNDRCPTCNAEIEPYDSEDELNAEDRANDEVQG